MTTTTDANDCKPSETEEEEGLGTYTAMEEGLLETNIDNDNDDDNEITTDIHHRPMMITHLSIMREDSPLLGGGSTPEINKKKQKQKRNWYKTSSWMIRSLWKSYQESIDRYPLWTKCWTSGILTSLGDLAPISHYYYLALDEKFPPTPYPWTKTTLIKLMIDQLLFAPSFLLVVFVFLDVLDGQMYDAMGHHLQQDFGSTLIANWKLWLPATIINLAFVSPEYRVLYSNIIFFVWTILLAMLVVVPTATTTTTTTT
eukprot:scaffold4291_cov75-Cylindrotheca_fusiformis.AAC.1